EMDVRQHRLHETGVRAVRFQLRLVQGANHLPAGILPLEPVVLPEDAGAGTGLPEKSPGELVPGLPDGSGKRAGGGRMLLAARGNTRRAERAGTVVLPHHKLCRPTPPGYESTLRLARARPGDAAQLDWEVGRGAN